MMFCDRFTKRLFLTTALRARKTCFKWANSIRQFSVTSKILGSSLALIIFCGAASAQVSAPQEKMTNILREVMRTDIPITRELHKDFWSELRMFSPNEQADFLRTISAATVEAHAYQIEVWESALLSFRKGKVFKSGKMLSLEDQMRSRILQTLPATLPEKTRQAAVKEFGAKYQNSILNSSRLLEAAANHQPLQVPGRGSFDVNETTLQLTIARLKGTFDRIQRLLNPLWSEVAVLKVLP
jgi:hypothetical protein